jgi:hypothetical protein
MGIQIVIQYNNHPLTYEVAAHESEIYQLRLYNRHSSTNGTFIPEKINIRKKGKIWVSDIEDCNELVGALTTELIKFRQAS